MAVETAYAALSPLGWAAPHTFVSAPPLESPVRASVCLMSTGVTRSDDVLDLIRQDISTNYPGVTVRGPLQLGQDTDDWERGLAGRVAELACDVMIVGVASTGSNTPDVIRAAELAERSGLRTVCVALAGMREMIESIVESMGMMSWPVAYVNQQIMTLNDEELSRAAADVGGQLRDLLRMRPLPSSVRTGAANRRPVVVGGLETVNRFFIEESLSDGLPIVPPTLDRIAEFLRFTTCRHDHVLGYFPPQHREATAWNVAANGVMAGCYPEHMPILIAIAEAVLEPRFGVKDIGASPGWEPLVILSGDAVRRLSFNDSGGVMRFDRHANVCVGRFVRLFLRNVAGWRLRGGLDNAAIGMGANAVLAENTDAVAAVGWPTYGEEHGQPAATSTISVQSVVAVSPPIYTSGADPRRHLDLLATVFGQQLCGYWVVTGYRYGEWHPLLVMCPAVARILGAAGWTKQSVRRYLSENSLVSIETLRRSCDGIGLPEPDWSEFRRPGGLVPALPYPEMIQIVISGDSLRSQSRGYLQNHRQGIPTAKAIRFVNGWQDMAQQGMPHSAAGNTGGG